MNAATVAAVDMPDTKTSLQTLYHASPFRFSKIQPGSYLSASLDEAIFEMFTKFESFTDNPKASLSCFVTILPDCDLDKAHRTSSQFGMWSGHYLCEIPVLLENRKTVKDFFHSLDPLLQNIIMCKGDEG